MVTMVRIRINGSFRGQTITGQQRYASEVARYLTARKPESVYERAPGRWWARNSIRTWIWCQTVGAGRRRGEVLLTLTSRGPLAARRHVIVVHDLFVFTHPEWFSRRYAWSHVPVLWIQIFSARAIVAVSDPVAVQVRALTKGRKTVLVAPNAPAEAFLQGPGPTEAFQLTLGRLGLTSGRFILAVGSLDPRKNLARLIEAHRSLPDSLRMTHPLVIVGERNPATGQVWLTEDPATRLLGRTTDEELGALYGSSSLVAFPTLGEGFGLPAVEALAAGANLLVSDIAVMRWVCGEFASYVDPLSVDDIAQGLTRVLTGPVSSREDRAARRHYALSRFSWELTAKLIAEGLENLSSGVTAPVASNESA